MVAPDIKVEPVVKNPYVGPKPFEIYEQNLFFGRDWEAEQLVALVMAHPAILLYAQSGAGKSSLLNAKVIPTLELDEDCEVLPVARVRGDLPPDVQIEQIKNRYVFNTLLSWADLADLDPEEMVDCSMTQLLRLLPRPGDEEGYPMLRVLVFDQFEELFTFYPERWPEREGFFKQVSEALVADPFLRALFVIREDYLAQLDAYAIHLPEQLRSRFRLERLAGEAALAAIEGPLKESRRSFAPGVAQELVNELLKIRVEGSDGTVIERPGEFVEPVQLQVVCQSLWNGLPPEVTQITLEHLRAFGNIDQALTLFYEKAIQETVAAAATIPLYAEWRLRNWFEQEAITPAGTRGIVYRGARKTETISNEEIDILESHHIIRAERRAGARWYELTHDRFIGPIQKANAAWRVAMLKKWGRIIGVTLSVIVAGLFIGTTTGTPNPMPYERETATAQARELAQVIATATAAGTTVAEVKATTTAAAVEAAVEVKATGTAVVEEAYAASTTAARTAVIVQATSTAAAEEVMATATAVAQTVRKERVRPLRAGLSIGGQNATAGTLGYFAVNDQGQVFMISVADVLGAALGNPVLQPGPFDGGQTPDDVVARLSNRLPLTGRTLSIANLIGLAHLDPGIEIEAAIPGNGPVLGVRAPEVGLRIRKWGRSTGWTEGEITAVAQTLPVTLGNNQTVQVQDVILAELESSPGDAGAIVLDDQGYAIALLVAGSGLGETYLAPIQTVLDLFDVRLLPPTLQIQDVSASLPWHPVRQYPQRNESEIQRIVLHHTVTSVSVQRIAAVQVDRLNFPGIAYHYCVTDQGTVYQTQPLDLAVFSAGNFSAESIDICLIGDFTKTPPSRDQLNAAAVLIAYLVQQYGMSVDQIFGYKDLAASQSPGATWERWRGELLAKVADLGKSGVSVTVVTQEVGN